MTVSLYICLIFLVSNSQSSIIYNLVFFVLSEAHLHFIKCFPAAQYPTARSLAYNSITISPYLTHLRSSVSTGVSYLHKSISTCDPAIFAILLLTKFVLHSMLGGSLLFGGCFSPFNLGCDENVYFCSFSVYWWDIRTSLIHWPLQWALYWFRLQIRRWAYLTVSHVSWFVTS